MHALRRVLEGSRYLIEKLSWARWPPISIVLRAAKRSETSCFRPDQTGRDEKFESISLQRGVGCEPDFLDQDKRPPSECMQERPPPLVISGNLPPGAVSRSTTKALAAPARHTTEILEAVISTADRGPKSSGWRGDGSRALRE